MTGQVVIVGAGQLRGNREKDPARAAEPLDLIERAIRNAAADAGIAFEALAGVGAVGVVQVVSWAYDTVAAAVAGRIGATRAKAFESGAGGHQPVAVLAELAARIADGEAELALLCGGEAQSSLELLGAGQDPAAAAGWSHEPGGPVPFARETGGTEAMWDLGLVGPIRVYPLWENRLRHDLGQSLAQAQAESARLYADFSRVASQNEAAWHASAVTAEEILAVGPRNRMICFPYPLLMNALNRVDQAAAVLLASPAAADRLGVPPRRRVYLHAAATDADCEDVLERESYGRAPGGERAMDAALAAAGVAPGEVDVVDLYSCFPVVPKLGRRHLRLPAGTALSATGGLTSFGGPHNNYSSHAVVAVTRRLREERLREDSRSEDGATGLVYAQGEYLTRHAAVVLGTRPAAGGFRRSAAPAPEHGPVRVDATWAGPLEIETYTVEYDRAGEPGRGYVIGRTPGGARSGLRVSKSDRVTLAALTDQHSDPIGRSGQVTTADGRRLFTLAR